MSSASRVSRPRWRVRRSLAVALVLGGLVTLAGPATAAWAADPNPGCEAYNQFHAVGAPGNEVSSEGKPDEVGPPPFTDFDCWDPSTNDYIFRIVYFDDPWARLLSTVNALLDTGWEPLYSDYYGTTGEYATSVPVTEAELRALPATAPDDPVWISLGVSKASMGLQYTPGWYFDYYDTTSALADGSLTISSWPSSRGLGLDDPSVLSGLRAIGEAVTPAQVGFASGGAVVLGLLMIFPSRLLSAVKDRLLPQLIARFKQWRARRKPPAAAPAAQETPTGSTTAKVERLPGWKPALAGLAAASILTVFIDPGAGLNAGTFRLFGSVFLAFVADVAIGWIVLSLVVSKLVPAASPKLDFKPVRLLLVLGAVIFTRVAQYEPGLALGLVAGIVFVGALAASDRARLNLTVLGYGFVLAVLAWVVFSVLNGIDGWGDAAWSVFLNEALAATTVAGIAALPLALLPVRGLVGYDILKWNRVAWGIAYGVGLAAFLLVLVPLPSSWKEVPISFVAWIVLFLLYVVGAVAAWLAVFKPWKPQPGEEAGEATATEVESPHR